jgi:hypothetical protein
MGPDRRPLVGRAGDVSEVLVVALGVMLGTVFAVAFPVALLWGVDWVVPVHCTGSSCALLLVTLGVGSFACWIGLLAWASRRGVLTLPSA